MPYKSRAQAAYFNIHRKELEAQGVDVDEWNAASKGKKLPKHKADGGSLYGYEPSGKDDPIARLLRRQRMDDLAEEFIKNARGGVFPPEALYARKGLDILPRHSDQNTYDPRDIGRLGMERLEGYQPAYSTGSYAEGGEVDDGNMPPVPAEPFAPLRQAIFPKAPPISAYEAAAKLSAQRNNFDPLEMAVGLGGAPAGGGSAIMVGPYGAAALRNLAGPRQLAAMEHPIVGYSGEQGSASGANKMLMNIKDPGERDRAARDLLEYRRLSGDPTDEDIFKASGWFRGEEGAAKREIKDIGAKMVGIPKGQPSKEAIEKIDPMFHEYITKDAQLFHLEHPSGNLHNIYDVPPIIVSKTAPRGSGLSYGDAGTNPKTGQIFVVADPSTKSGQGLATKLALHEMQHMIQYREGFALGSSPRTSLHKKEFWDELGMDMPESHIGRQMGGLKPENAMSVYKRHSGEVESRNVERRRQQGYNYLQHPTGTEDIGGGLQIIDDQGQTPVGFLTRVPKRAAGGGIDEFAVHSAARNFVRSGMLNSRVPGRTDKLGISVPSGAYVVPADVVSGLGQGNSMAGANALAKMFSTGPLGMATLRGGRGRAGHAARIGTTRLPRGSKTTSTLTQTFAEGGTPQEEQHGEPTPVLAAGGEYLIDPVDIRRKFGNLENGHRILDQFVLHSRKKHINDLKGLKPPVKS